MTRPECSILDFKAEFYDFTNDSDGAKISKFVKDILSFCNTIREHKAYIILGVKELPDKSKEKIGITSSIDDAILQDKVKSKIYPRANFNFSVFEFEGKSYGIIEFPVVRYEMPLTSTVKLKGIEIGTVYYRQGSTNCHALALDVIRINDWLKSLPVNKTDNSLHNILSQILATVTSGKQSISSLLLGLQLLAKQNGLQELLTFIKNELSGINVSDNAQRADIEMHPEKYNYRVQSIKVSAINIQPNPYGLQNAEELKFEIQNNKDFYDFAILFKYPITEIECIAIRKMGTQKWK